MCPLEIPMKFSQIILIPFMEISLKQQLLPQLLHYMGVGRVKLSKYLCENSLKWKEVSEILTDRQQNITTLYIRILPNVRLNEIFFWRIFHKKFRPKVNADSPRKSVNFCQGTVAASRPPDVNKFWLDKRTKSDRAELSCKVGKRVCE